MKIKTATQKFKNNLFKIEVNSVTNYNKWMISSDQWFRKIKNFQNKIILLKIIVIINKIFYMK